MSSYMELIDKVSRLCKTADRINTSAENFFRSFIIVHDITSIGKEKEQFFWSNPDNYLKEILNNQYNAWYVESLKLIETYVPSNIKSFKNEHEKAVCYIDLSFCSPQKHEYSENEAILKIFKQALNIQAAIIYEISHLIGQYDFEKIHHSASEKEGSPQSIVITNHNTNEISVEVKNEVIIQAFKPVLDAEINEILQNIDLIKPKEQNQVKEICTEILSDKNASPAGLKNKLSKLTPLLNAVPKSLLAVNTFLQILNSLPSVT
ncbi:hypothetical protein [Methanococcoides seepicolus]|uniref:Uncharacterized protein n=1 Tax=Methanococcoides seepicolus TaxID=2828780 RepID=A0A9E4ZJT7_9EURY|nr:hypothetical protein [Methanococcoides seepicolus]MCM1987739.1 hypothetical protein [Methanococcoides seepicolus]